jgi:hypothetical protein
MIEDVLSKAKEYRERASRYLQNYEGEIEKGDKEKGGEALWGVISCQINAIYLVENGRPSTSHSESARFARQFIISKFGEIDGEELVQVYRKVEKFHANFYHAFLDEEEFKKYATDIMRLIKYLDELIGGMISKIEMEMAT